MVAQAPVERWWNIHRRSRPYSEIWRCPQRCDEGEFYNYEELFGVEFGMDKRERIMTFDSGSSHAMTLMAVDLDKDGNPKKWQVENSWGAGSGFNGTLIMTDEWFDEYMFRLVVDKKYVPAKVLDVLKQKPTMLPAWDPMFTPEE